MRILCHFVVSWKINLVWFGWRRRQIRRVMGRIRIKRSRELNLGHKERNRNTLVEKSAE